MDSNNLVVADATPTDNSLTLRLSPKMKNPKSALFAALAKAQAGFASPVKDAKYNYGRYATLTGCLEAVKPALNENGLFITQPVEPLDARNMKITTVVYHESGESIELGSVIVSVDTGGRMNINQAAGSAITYGRRYSLCAALGIAAIEDDDDGNASGQGSAAEYYATKRKAPTTAQTKTHIITAEEINAIVGEWTAKFCACKTPEEITEVASGVQKLPKPARDELVAVYKENRKRINGAMDKAVAAGE